MAGASVSLCADVPVEPVPLTGRETDIDAGLVSFAFATLDDRCYPPRLALVPHKAALLPTPQEGDQATGESAADGEAGARVRHNRSRRFASRPSAHESSFGQVHSGSIADATWYMFLNRLARKAVCAGTHVEAANPTYTSQTCSGDGVIITEGLSVREHCGACLPGLRCEPVWGPQRRQKLRHEQRTARAEPSGGRGERCGGEENGAFPACMRGMSKVCDVDHSAVTGQYAAYKCWDILGI